MKYQGGKSRQGKRIAAVLNRFLADKHWFYEPFVGGFNIVRHIETDGKIFCSDSNQALITLYKQLQKGWVPPQNISEEEYRVAKQLPDSDPLKAFVGFGCSFGAKYFSGYARYNDYNFCKKAHDSIMRKHPFMGKVSFACLNYTSVPLYPHHSVIYCDPPYAGSQGYGGQKKFDSDAFWLWCENISKYHYIFVSEYTCPVKNEVMMEIERSVSLAKDDKHTKTIEKLFRIGEG